MRQDVPDNTQRARAMNAEYFQTLFSTEAPWEPTPQRFAIISGHATTGQTWTEHENRAADAALREALAPCPWVQRIVGYSPSGDHAEDSWAVTMPFEDACDLGLRFRQDAIYYVEDDILFVSYCDARRARLEVGAFSERLSERPRKT